MSGCESPSPVTPVTPVSADNTDISGLRREQRDTLVVMRQEAEALDDPLLLRLYDMIIYHIITGP